MAAPSQTRGDGLARHPVDNRRAPVVHWKLLGAILLFLAFAPAGLIAVPLAALLGAGLPRTLAEILLLVLAAALGLSWLLDVGPLPDQALRAGVVFSTVSFVLIGRLTDTSVPHRALVAVGITTVCVALLVFITGSSWAEVRWWVAHEAQQAANLFLRAMWVTAPVGPDGLPELAPGTAAAQLEGWVRGSVQFVADHFPAIAALEVGAGLAIASAIDHRAATHPIGTPLGRLRDFQFSEHVGWFAIVPLLILLLPGPAGAKLGAANLLLVIATLYLVRGAGVAVHGLAYLRAGVLPVTLAAVAALLLLPITVTSVILLGVVDARLDLRTRWRTRTPNSTSH